MVDLIDMDNDLTSLIAPLTALLIRLLARDTADSAPADIRRIKRFATADREVI